MEYSFDPNKSFSKNGRRYVNGHCSRCGKESSKRLDHVQRNYGFRCSCKNFGLSGKRPQHIWRSMLDRCNNPKNHAYSNYGGRGITVDPAWMSFEAFWLDMKDDYKDSLTIERIDNNKGYCKENCRWATPFEQARNTRKNVWIEHQGKKMIAADWCKELGRSYQAVRQRVYEGKTYKQALHLD